MAFKRHPNGGGKVEDTSFVVDSLQRIDKDSV